MSIIVWNERFAVIISADLKSFQKPSNKNPTSTATIGLLEFLKSLYSVSKSYHGEWKHVFEKNMQS